VTKTFSRNQRLLTAADYRRVFSAPESKAGQAECLLLAAFNELGHHRLGLAVAKKHIPTAVRRNQFKRIAREEFRHLEDSAAGVDIVVLSRAAANTASTEELRDAIGKQLRRVLRRIAPAKADSRLPSDAGRAATQHPK
jgi:ribonuclease P protein component